MFTRLESGAEQEMEVVTRWESGAETEAEGVYTVKNGAEEEVWSNTAYTFHQYGQYNATINGDGSATMGFSWNAQSGNDANLVIRGAFEAGKEYTLTFDGEVTVSAVGSGSDGTTVYGVFEVGSTSQSYTIVTGSNTVTITPKASGEYLEITISHGGQYSGSVTAKLTDIRINGRLVKK